MENNRLKNKKKLFSLYKVFDFEKNDYVTMMHTYKRDLTPVRENFTQCNPQTPYEDNFNIFSNNFAQSNFKQEYLNLNQDVQVSSKNKNFSTFSVLQTKPVYAQQYQCNKSQNIKSENSQQNNIRQNRDSNQNEEKKKKSLQDNIKKLKEARGINQAVSVASNVQINKPKPSNSNSNLTALFTPQPQKSKEDGLFSYKKEEYIQNEKQNVPSEKPHHIARKSSKKRIIIQADDVQRNQDQIIGNFQTVGSQSKITVLKKDDLRQTVAATAQIPNTQQIQEPKQKSIFLYNPADDIPSVEFQSMKDTIYTAIFNYKEPLSKQIERQNFRDAYSTQMKSNDNTTTLPNSRKDKYREVTQVIPNIEDNRLKDSIIRHRKINNLSKEQLLQSKRKSIKAVHQQSGLSTPHQIEEEFKLPDTLRGTPSIQDSIEKYNRDQKRKKHYEKVNSFNYRNVKLTNL